MSVPVAIESLLAPASALDRGLSAAPERLPDSSLDLAHADHCEPALHARRHHLLDVGDLSDAVVLRLWQRADELKQREQRGLSSTIFGTLRGHVVATLFFEASTRTRLSFELAAQRLGALTLPLDVSRSSLEKSESLQDTLQTLAAMGATMAVVRHRDNAVFSSLGSQVGLSLLNAGNGTEAHPTQALLDAFTIRQQLGSLQDRVVVIHGDILHSRVARSNARLLHRFGARVLLSGPGELLPTSDELSQLAGAQLCPLDEALPQADVIMCLRVQRERHSGTGHVESGAQPLPYLRVHGLTQERFARAKPGCLILHPGPVNRDVEIESALVDHPRSQILQQVRNGLFIRMATLEWIAGVLP